MILSRSEQREAVERYQSFGDEQSRAEVVESNKGLVRMIAVEFSGLGVDHDDLLQEGQLGLLRAVKKFDLSKDRAFSTYATIWVRGFMQQAVKKTIKRKRECVSLDIIDEPEEERERSRERRDQAASTVKKHLASLPKRDAKLLSLRFGMDGTEPKTLEEIGQEMGFTRERARQLLSVAMGRFRKRAERDRE